MPALTRKLFCWSFVALANGTLTATSPEVLFDLPLADEDFDNLIGKTRNYAMLPDGVRFLVRSQSVPQETGIRVLLGSRVLETDR